MPGRCVTGSALECPPPGARSVRRGSTRQPSAPFGTGLRQPRSGEPPGRAPGARVAHDAIVERRPRAIAMGMRPATIVSRTCPGASRRRSSCTDRRARSARNKGAPASSTITSACLPGSASQMASPSPSASAPRRVAARRPRARRAAARDRERADPPRATSGGRVGPDIARRAVRADAAPHAGVAPARTRASRAELQVRAGAVDQPRPPRETPPIVGLEPPPCAPTNRSLSTPCAASSAAVWCTTCRPRVPRSGPRPRACGRQPRSREHSVRRATAARCRTG